MRKYYGYTNRETYYVVLWCQNVEDFYQLFRNQQAKDIRAQFEKWTEQLIKSPLELTEELRRVLVAIGCLWWVNWREVADVMADETKEVAE